MNEKKRGSWERTYYYVQAHDNKTNNFLGTALPEDAVWRSSKESVGSRIRSSHKLYLVPWKDVECFMQIAYLSFNVFIRKEREALPHFVMMKSVEIEKRNTGKEKPNGVKLSLVRKTKAPMVFKIVENPRVETPKKMEKGFPENPELAEKNAKRLARVERPKKRTLFLLSGPKPVHKEEEQDKETLKLNWSRYVIMPQQDSSNEVSVSYIRKALFECGLSTQSVYENGKLYEESFEQVWEADGNTLFKLWCYARRNPLIHFVVLRTSKDGFKNFKEFFYYPKDELEEIKPEEHKNKVLVFRQS